MVGRDAVAHGRQPHRVEPHERDGEARPEFLLELRQHALEGDDEDARAATALNQLSGEDAGFERLAEPSGVGDEDPLRGEEQRDVPQESSV